MNENLNLVEILKDCPKNMQLYCPIFGNVYFQEIKDTGHAVLIKVVTSCNTTYEFYHNGKFNKYYKDSECLLFPSKENRDWTTFVAPKKKVERFDTKTLKPFDQVLVRDNALTWSWTPRILSYIDSDGIFVDTSGEGWDCAIPYKGNETLALCTDDPEDEFYRYWED